MDPTTASLASSALSGILGGESKSEKSSIPLAKQYAMGLFGSLFFPQYAQAFASYKPQEYQQLFGQPGQNALQILQPFFGLNNVQKTSESKGLGF
ncbi:MAG TPA: hypothetical protein VFA15_02385 [Nitrososphaera sp.]|nr:hypothetical protein [Nitrososphaera sp.]